MARPPKNPEAAGVYRRGDWFWLRHTVNGEEIRQPLRTQLYEEAITKAKELRGQVPDAQAKVKGGWDAIIEKYLREKQNPKRPPGFTGKRWMTFRPGTVVRVRSCLKTFATWSGLPSPSKVTLPKLEAYLERVSKKSKAGGRTTLATINSFLAHVGCLPGRVQLPEKKELERREIVRSIAEGNELIEAAPNDRLRFVLYCGFHAGLRRGEIMHARPPWFQLSRRILRVPRVDELGENRFAVKDSETRDIPLSAAFADFMREFLKGVKPDEYCLQNPTKRRSRAGTYDFRRPFSDFVSEAGHPELFPHAMRHSWITELCNSGNHTVQEVASWSGDSLETIEKNYWHKRATPGALDETMRGVRKGSEQAALFREMAEKLDRLVEAGKIDKSAAAELWKGFESEEEERGMNERWAAEDEYKE